MLKVIKHNQTRFRIQIYDLKEKRTKTISVENHEHYKVEDIKNLIIDCLERGEKFKKNK